MAYGLNADSVDGGFWDMGSTYDQPVYAETVTSDIATQGQTVQTSATNDNWTEFFKNTAGALLNYGLKRDAVLTGAQVQKTLQQPTAAYYPTTGATLQQGASATPQGIAISTSTLVMVAGAVALYALLTK